MVKTILVLVFFALGCTTGQKVALRKDRMVIVRGVSSTQQQDEALVLHSGQGDLQQVSDLLGKGADPNASITTEEGGGTALVGAASAGHADVVKALIEAGADVNLTWYPLPGQGGISPLVTASSGGHKEVVIMLLEAGALVDKRAGIVQQNTPLVAATLKGRTEIVEVLLRARAHPNLTGGRYNETPLMIAAGNCNFEIIKLILEVAYVNINFRNSRGESALGLADAGCSRVIVDYLRGKGATVGNVPGVSPRPSRDIILR